MKKEGRKKKEEKEGRKMTNNKGNDRGLEKIDRIGDKDGGD